MMLISLYCFSKDILLSYWLSTKDEKVYILTLLDSAVNFAIDVCCKTTNCTPSHERVLSFVVATLLRTSRPPNFQTFFHSARLKQEEEKSHFCSFFYKIFLLGATGRDVPSHWGIPGELIKLKQLILPFIKGIHCIPELNLLILDLEIGFTLCSICFLGWDKRNQQNMAARGLPKKLQTWYGFLYDNDDDDDDIDD